MQGKNSNSSDSITSILNEISAENENLSVADAEKKIGLDFRYGEEPEPVTKREVRVDFEAAKAEEKKKEFSVPEKFRSGPKYNSASESKAVPSVSVTYVPRFTGISENYRMSDEPNAMDDRVASKLAKAKAQAAIDDNKGNIDPTAEIDTSENGINVQIGSAKNMTEEFESSSKVFKFDKNEDAEEKEERVGFYIAEEPQESPELSAQDEETSEEDTAEEAKVEEYSIPDPEALPAQLENTVFTAIVANSVLEDSPDGAAADETTSNKTKEYVSYAQRDSFKDRFIDTVMSIYVRLFAALALMVVVAFVELSFALGADIPAILGISAVPGAMALLDFQFVICLYLLALPETILSIKNLIGKKITPELFLTVSFAVLVAYTVVITVNAPAKYMLFGLMFAVFAVVSMLASLFKTSADFTAFKRASKNGEKTVIGNSFTRNLELENAALDGAVEEYKSKTARTFRVLFLSDFFKRTAVCAENKFNLFMIFGVSLGFALVVGLITLFIPGGWVNAITGFTLVFMLSCPAASILLRKLPYFYASREAEVERSAIIGERSLYEYSGVDVITFDDKEVFGEEDVTLQRIMLYGKSENLSKALRQSAALFMNVGGPLDVLFSNSLDKKCSPAGAVTVEAGGVSGIVDGHQILAGTLDYMLSKKARLPVEENAIPEKTHNSTKVIFVAEDEVVYAKFYIRYSFSEDFTMLLPTLEDANITPLVYTRDPNVTNALISALTAGAGKVRIMRKFDTQSGEVIYRKASAGIVTNGDKSNAINMILLSKRYKNLQSYFNVAELSGMTVGAILAAILAIVGATAMPSLVFAAFQLAWCGALYLTSLFSFRSLKRKKQ